MHRSVLTALSLLLTCGSANAFEFRCRFVERVGNTDTVLSDNRIETLPGVSRNIRLQIGVFDDAAGPAPLGGFVGWNVGTLTSFAPNNAWDLRRNNGRLSPFNFSQHPNANGNPPLPGGDPFMNLTEIDATLGTQSPVWVCNAQGNAPPPPAATVRGRNTFVSVFAFRIDPEQAPGAFRIVAGGNLIAAESWQVVGNPVAPDCGDPLDPSDDIAGTVTYAPVPTAPRGFSCELVVLNNEPTPGAGMTIILGAAMASRRRRAQP